jgi:hypothetical protein
MPEEMGHVSTAPLKRILAGAALAILGLLVILFPMRDKVANIILALIVGLPGVLLIYFGLRADRRALKEARDWKGPQYMTLKRLPGTEKEAIQALVEIYHEHPQGFLTGSSSPEAKMIRAIGDMLDEKGGMPLMLRVHEVFSSRCGIYGAPRNLEHMWDNIGEWRG